MATSVLRLVIDSRAARSGAQDFRRSTDRVERSARSATRQTERMDGSFRRLSSSAATLRNAFAALGIALVVREFISLTDAMTKLRTQLRIVTDSERELVTIQDQLFRLSQETRTSFEATTVAFARIARASSDLGVSNERLIGVMETLNQAITTSGATAIEANAAMIQLSQGLASGTLRGDELRSVAEQLPRVLQAIIDGARNVAPELNLTKQNFRDLAAEGRINADLIIRAFEDQADVLREEFTNVERTTGQALQQVRNSLVRVIGEMGNASGAAGDFNEALDDLRKTIETEGFAQGVRAIGSAIAFVAGAIGDLVAQVGRLAELLDRRDADSLQDLILENRPFQPFTDLTNRQILERFGVIEPRIRVGGVSESIRAAGGFGQDDFSGGPISSSGPSEEFTETTEELRQQLDIAQRLLDVYDDFGVATGLVSSRHDELEEALSNVRAIEAARDALLSAELIPTTTSLADVEKLLGDTQNERIRIVSTLALSEFEANRQIGERKDALEEQIEKEKEAAEAIEEAREEALEKLKDRAEERQRILQEPFLNAIRGIQNAFTDTFESIFSGGVRSFSDLADSIKQIFIRLAAEIATLLVFRPIVGGILGGAGLGGLAQNLGVGGTGFGDILSLGQNLGGGGGLFGGGGFLGLNSVSLGGLFSTATTQGATGLAAGVGGVGPAFVENAVAAQTGLLPTSFGSFLGGAGAGFGAGSLLNSLVGGNQLGGTVGSGVGSLAGAAIGSFTPLGPIGGGLIGGALGGLVGGLFGGGGDSGDNTRLVTSATSNIRRAEDNIVLQTPFGFIANRDASENLSKKVVRNFLQSVQSFDEAVAELLSDRQTAIVAEALQSARVVNRRSGVDSVNLGGITRRRGRIILRGLGLEGDQAREIARGGANRVAERVREAISILNIVQPETAAESIDFTVQQITERFDDMIRKAREWGFEVDKIIERRDEEIQLIREGGQLGLNVRGQTLQAGQTLLDFLNAESLSPTAGLAPLDALSEARRQFENIFSEAQGGDLSQVGNLTGSAGTLLNIARDIFASSPEFQAIRQNVRGRLGELGEDITGEESIADRVTEAIRQQTLAEQDSSAALLEQVEEMKREIQLLRSQLAEVT